MSRAGSRGSSSFVSHHLQGCLLTVVVTPRAKKSKVAGLHGGLPKVVLAAPPVDGKANEELVSFLSDLTGYPKRAFSLVRGEKSREKTLYIAGADVETVRRALGETFEA